MIIPLNVRLHHQRRHHGDHVEEKNDVPDKWIGGILPQKNLEVSPEHMRAEPHPATERHQSPEKLSSLIARSNVG